MLRYLSVSQKQWNVRLNLWQKLVIENETCELKIQHWKTTIRLSSCSKCCPSRERAFCALGVTDRRPCSCRRRCTSAQSWRRWGTAL